MGFMNMNNKRVITIVGGGSSAHALIPFLSMAGHKVNILTRRPTDWSSEVEVQLQSIEGEVKEAFRGSLSRISNKASEVIPQADIIVLCMPVSQYRLALHNIAPYVPNEERVFIGTIYGQAGFNWMVDEIKGKFNLTRVSTFAVGLSPWICRTIEYGRTGVTYGCKEVNVAAVIPHNHFAALEDFFLKDICERWFNRGTFRQSDNFLSLTLSVDNQIIHPSRCYGLFLRYGGKWKTKNDVPYFYRDFDRISADVLQKLDADYSKIRNAIKEKYPQKNFSYMLDYLALERLSYQSHNTDIIESFTTSQTLGAIKPPIVQQKNGEWAIDTNHRFFSDDIHYGLCIAKWMADQLNLRVPTIDKVIEWAQMIRHENIIKGGKLLVGAETLETDYLFGIPSVYGFKSINDVID